MLSFRILGPLEVTDGQAAIALGGPRQRALLVALLLRAGRVVPTEQLVDELYGAEPPKNATTSMQNSVVALRKALGPDVLLFRAPGYLLSVSPEQVDVASLRGLLGDARRAAPDERRALLDRALELWRGPPLAEFAFEDWAQGEIRRLDELRLVAVEERIAADIELDHAADVVAELEALVGEHPLRERARELLMLALYRAGRQAEALEPTETHARARRARYRAGREAPAAAGRDPAPRCGGSQRGRTATRHDADGEIVKALSRAASSRCSGSTAATDLASELAAAFGVPGEPAARPRTGRRSTSPR